MNAFLKLLAGLAIVALIGFAAFTLDGAPGSAASARHKLEVSAFKAIGPDSSGWASVKVDGQKLIVSGEAPSEEARNAVIARLSEANGPGGLIMGAITAVDASALTVVKAPPIVDPFIFIAEHEGGALAFSGYVPDQQTKDALYRLATEIFQDTNISGELDIAGGAPASPAIWRNAAETSLRALYYLHNGAVAAEGMRFSVTGDAETEVRAEAARMLMSALPGGLSGDARITVNGAPVPAKGGLAPSGIIAAETIAAPVAAKESAPVSCLERLKDAVADLRIVYSSAQSDLDAATQNDLYAFAPLFRDCPAGRLQITGHTDSRGRAPGNLLLSRERAGVVRDFLVASGAPEDRIVAIGAGESEPIASNASQAGRQRNRRIEFKIISAD